MVTRVATGMSSPIHPVGVDGAQKVRRSSGSFQTVLLVRDGEHVKRVTTSYRVDRVTLSPESLDAARRLTACSASSAAPPQRAR